MLLTMVYFDMNDEKSANSKRNTDGTNLLMPPVSCWRSIMISSSSFLGFSFRNTISKFSSYTDSFSEIQNSCIKDCHIQCKKLNGDSNF